jgi:ADP-ribosylglycohydrolase
MAAPARSPAVARRAAAAVVGALVADAAGLGVHWLYGDGQVERVVGARPEFVAPQAANYRPQGPDYFAHGRKSVGDVTHCGELGLLSLRHLAARGELDALALAKQLVEVFGPGGTYTGYIDSAIRLTLDNIARRESGQNLPPPPPEVDREAFIALRIKFAPLFRIAGHDPQLLHTRVEAAIRATHNEEMYVAYGRRCVDAYLAERYQPTGADDVQMDGLALLPAVVALYAGRPDFDERVEAAVRVLQNNNAAVSYMGVAARVLEAVILGKSPAEAVEHVRGATDWARRPELAEVRTRLEEAVQLAASNSDTVAVTGHFGRSCYARMGIPSAVHTMLRATSYAEGVRGALLAGGDSVTRAAFVGAVLAAQHGLGSPAGVPARWLLKTRPALEALELAEKLLGAQLE